MVLFPKLTAAHFKGECRAGSFSCQGGSSDSVSAATPVVTSTVTRLHELETLRIFSMKWI